MPGKKIVVEVKAKFLCDDEEALEAFAEKLANTFGTSFFGKKVLPSDRGGYFFLATINVETGAR